MKDGELRKGGAIPRKESEAAKQAFNDYYDLGWGRSIMKLAAKYKADHEAGKTVPTIWPARLNSWSSAFGWQDRLMNRAAQIAEKAEAKLADERVAMARQRLTEARGAHTIAGMLIQEFLGRLRGGELKDLPAVGHWEALAFETRTDERDWEVCPVCEGKSAQPESAGDKPAAPSICLSCNGEGKRWLGKGRRKVATGTKIVKVEGLSDLLASLGPRLLEAGQKLERTELGLDTKDKTERLVDELLNALPPELRQQVAAELAASLAAGSPDPARR